MWEIATQVRTSCLLAHPYGVRPYKHNHPQPCKTSPTYQLIISLPISAENVLFLIWNFLARTSYLGEWFGPLSYQMWCGDGAWVKIPGPKQTREKEPGRVCLKLWCWFPGCEQGLAVPVLHLWIFNFCPDNSLVREEGQTKPDWIHPSTPGRDEGRLGRREASPGHQAPPRLQK